MAHGVERVGDDDEDGVGGILRDFARDATDNRLISLDQFIAARELPGDGILLARNARRDDDDIRAFGQGVVAAAGDAEIIFHDRAGFGQVERLAFCHAVENVHEHDVRQFAAGDPVRTGRANVARANYRYFTTSHNLVYSNAVYMRMAQG